jgi:hypothetical protein
MTAALPHVRRLLLVDPVPAVLVRRPPCRRGLGALADGLVLRGALSGDAIESDAGDRTAAPQAWTSRRLR